MKKLRTKFLSRLVLSTIMASCFSYAGLAHAEVIDMSSSANMGGVTIVDPQEELNNNYIYKWDKDKGTIVGGNISIVSNKSEQYLNVNLMIDKKDLPSMSAADINKAVEQMAQKLQCELPSDTWKVYAKVCVGEGLTDPKPVILRQYEIKVSEGSADKPSIGVVGSLSGATFDKPVTNDGKTNNECDFQNNQLYLGFGDYLFKPDFSQATTDHIYKAIYNSGKDLLISSRRDASTNMANINIVADASQDKQSKVYAIFNNTNKNTEVLFTNESNITVKGNEVVGAYAGGSDQLSQTKISGSSSGNININLEGTNKAYGLEADRNGKVIVNFESAGKNLKINAGDNGIGLYAHDGGQILYEGSDGNSVDITTKNGIAVLAENGGQIKGFELGVFNGDLKTDDNADSLIDVSLHNSNDKCVSTGNAVGNVKLNVSGSSSSQTFTWNGNFNSTNELTIGENGVWNGSSDLGTINNVTFGQNAVWNLTEQNKVPKVNNLSTSASTAVRSYINMGSQDLTIGTFAGNATFVYQHDASDPSIINGGNITVEKAKPLTIITEGLGENQDSTNTSTIDSTITLSTSADGIDLNDNTEVNKVLDSLTDKLTYLAYKDGERNLTGNVEIAEGLTSASITKKTSDLIFNEQTGKAEREDLVKTPFSGKIQGNKEVDKVYKDVISTGDDGNLIYTFNEDAYIIDKTVKDPRPMAFGTLYFGSINNYGNITNYNNSGTNAKGGASYTIDMQGHDLNIQTIVAPPEGTTGNQAMWNTSAIYALREGTITIDNPGAINIDYTANYYYGNAIAVGAATATPNGVHVIINNDNDKNHAVKIRGGITSPGYELNYAAIKASSSNDQDRNTIEISGLVDVEAKHAACVYSNKGGSYITIGGGRIVTPDFDAVMTSGDKARVDLNITKDEEGNAISGGSNDLEIKGGLATATTYWGTGGTINAAFTTDKSSLTGQVYGTGNTNMWLQNGAVWNNQAYNQHNWSTGSITLIDRESTVNYLHGGDSLDNAGIINQKSDKITTINDLDGSVLFNMQGKGDVVVDNYGGNNNVYYQHDALDPLTIKGGNFTINNAAEGSKINLITDNAGIDMQNEYVISDVLNSMAHKLFYTSYKNGERNLNGYVQIAEGLTSASATQYTGDIAFSEENGQGSLKADSINPEFTHPEIQNTTEFTTTLNGDISQSNEYIAAGVYKKDKDVFEFDKDKTTIRVEDTVLDGGAYMGGIGSAIYSYGDRKEDGIKNDLTIDMKGNALDIDVQNPDDTATGISAIGNSKVEINNAGSINIHAIAGERLAALYVNAGGQLVIHNGGENLQDKVLVVRGNADTAGNGALLKSMNGISDGRSWMKVDGLVDVYGEVKEGSGIAEGLSAVASTIEVGGGKIIMKGDDSDPELNFGGESPLAIRAYGEFTSKNYGIVNVNVQKEADTADAKAIGAGNNTTQIIGDFSTVGGMGTNGTINVGLNTKDSFWYGNYAYGSGFGVTPGDYGCLNLFMGNGAKWQGWTKYATNLKMDSGAEWTGYSKGDNTLIMELDNDAVWHHTAMESEDGLVTSSVRSFKGNGGYIDMTAKDAGDITVADYSGNTNVIYAHDTANPLTITGGNFTIDKAAEKSSINLITNNEGIKMDDHDQVVSVLDNLANKLVYNDAADKAANLKGSVQIAEGLLTSSATLMVGDITYKTDSVEDKNHGTVVKDSIQAVEPKPDPEKPQSDIIYGDSETGMMRGAKSAMASTAMIWRSENDDMLKRLGDLRVSDAEQGIWAKYYGGKSEMDAQKAEFSTKYNAYQVGYDKKVNDNWTVGAALSYNDGSSTYELGGDGDEKVISMSVYGTMMKDDGQYLDVVVKGSHLKNDYTVKNDFGKKLEGDYSTWGASISAEYGKRFEYSNGFYFDPSVELTVGRVAGKDYDAASDYLDGLGHNKDMAVSQDAFNSIIGKVGFGIGQKLDKASYYGKLSLAHEFSGDFDTSFKAEGEPEGHTSIDFGDTWYEVALGGTAQMSDNSFVYAEYSRSFGGDVTENWRVDAGLRFTF